MIRIVRIHRTLLPIEKERIVQVQDEPRRVNPARHAREQSSHRLRAPSADRVAKIDLVGVQDEDPVVGGERERPVEGLQSLDAVPALQLRLSDEVVNGRVLGLQLERRAVAGDSAA